MKGETQVAYRSSGRALEHLRFSLYGHLWESVPIITITEWKTVGCQHVRETVDIPQK